MKMINKKFIHWMIWFMYSIIMIAYIVSSIWGEKYLYMDGSLTTYRLLTEGTFIIYPQGRRNFDIISQMFAVFGYWLGCDQFKILACLYGFGLTGMTALVAGVTLFIAQRRDKLELGLIALSITTIQIIFMGHYIIVESLFGVTVFLQEVVLYLVHQDDRSVCAILEYVLIIFHLFFTIHLMEYYCLWAPLLILILLYRVFLCKGASELNKWWLSVAGWQGYITWRSYIDIEARGEAPGFNTLWKEIWQRNYYVYICFLIGLVAVITLIWALFLADKFRSGILLLAIIHVSLFGSLIRLTVEETDRLVINSSTLRWTNIPWGILGAVFLLLIFISYRSPQTDRRWFLSSYSVLLCILCIGTVCYEKVSGERQRDYHAQIVAYCDLVHRDEGFVDLLDTDFCKEPLRNYSNFWVTSYQCMDLFVLKDKSKITTVLYNSQKGEQMNQIETYKEIEKYGLQLELPEKE
ncbi:MAG: hypothetical protein K6A90_06845 [Lachnospiraceae bacterium]|nr:hypothetical protein [Lachnospiraceae bacterium]